MNNLINTTAIISIVLSLSACGGGYSGKRDGGNSEAGAPQAGPIFDPANGLIPSTNDLLFSGTTDGTLNIPNPNANPIITQVNTLDGFSTVNPIVADFGTPIEASSLIIGETVRVFNVTTGAAGFDELDASEIVALVPPGKPNSIAIVPLKPLTPKTRYAVVLTSGIKDTSGNNSTASLSYLLTKGATPLKGSFAALEPVRDINNGVETLVGALASPTLATSDIVLSWTFQTQSIDDVLGKVLDSAEKKNLVVASTMRNTKQVNPLLAGLADVYIGTLDVPYYLSKPTTENPIAPLTESWKGIAGSTLSKFNPTPINNGDITIPLMMTLPNIGVKPANGWPVVIFQHGITRSRKDMLAIADRMALAGIALIAIDLPLHGEAKLLEDGTNNTLHADRTPFPSDIEPTFDLDLVNNVSLRPGSDGNLDSSGTHFINLSNILVSRDNTRQGVSNLLTLRRSLSNIADINSSDVGFIAYSLGGIVGTTYLGIEPLVTPTSLVSSGGTITDILSTSGTRSGPIIGGLTEAGVTDIPAYFGGAQFIIDSADPVNYAQIAASKHPIHIIKVDEDNTVPNATTDKIANLMGAQKVITDTAVAAGSPVIVEFNNTGNHGSLLDPTANSNITKEMQNQIAEFHKDKGKSLVINDASVIQ